MNVTRIRTSVRIEEFSSSLTYLELTVVGSLLIAICLLTVIGNAIVLVSFIKDKRLRTLSNYFILSLAVSDFMIGIFSMPLFIAYLLIGQWILGKGLCDMWLAQDYTCGNASFMNLLMISFDRYFSVTSPLKYRAKRTGKRVALMISLVWITSFLVWPPWIYAWPYIDGKRTIPEDDCYVQFLETNSYATIITAVVDYYIPVIIMLVLYYKIWRETQKRNKYLADMEAGYQAESISLQKSLLTSENSEKKELSVCKTFNGDQANQKPMIVERDNDTEIPLLKRTTNIEVETINVLVKDNNVSDGLVNDNTVAHISEDVITISETNTTSPSENSNANTFSTKKKAFKHDSKAARVLTAILLAFIVTTTPYNVIVIIKNLDTSHTIVPDSVWNFFYFLFYVNSTLNPLCYALANENFRRTYWQILTCSWRKKPRYNVNDYTNRSQSQDSTSTKYLTSAL